MHTSNIAGFLGNLPHIYCLSLPQSSERRSHITSLFDSLGLSNFSFFEASQPNSGEVQDLYKNGLVKSFPDCFRCGKLECGKTDCNNTLIPPQVATFSSYIRLCRELTKSRHDYAMFIEDDIKLSSHADMHCESLNHSSWISESGLLDGKPCLIQAGWAYTEDHELSLPAKVGPFKEKLSNPAFMLNREMANLILEEFSGVETTVDIFIHRIVAAKAQSFTVYPPLFYEMSWSTGEVDSTIHPKKARVDFLKQAAATNESVQEAESRLQLHQKHTEVYPFLITGHPRCGSGFSAELMKSLGIEIGHEALLKDGISSWMFATDDICPWALNEGAKTRSFKHFKHTLMHARDPRTAVSSIMRDNQYAPKSYEFRRKHILSKFEIDLDDYSDSFQKAVASYVFWNELVLQQKPDFVFRIENDVENLCDYISTLTGVATKEKSARPADSVNKNKLYQGTRRPKPFTRESDFARLPSQLLNELNLLCAKLGYQEFKPVKDFDKARFIADIEKHTLTPTGWLRSAQENASVNTRGEPLPWWTTPATEFINGIVNKHWRVFEYGCGNSTLWWQKKVNQVIGVDHDEVWIEKVRSKLKRPNSVLHAYQSQEAPESAERIAEPYFSRIRFDDFDYDSEKLIRRGLNDADFIAYADAINSAGGKFDCIVIDGMARRLCTYFAIRLLTETGIIVFDNSNRSDYMEGYQFLVEQGFYQIRFSGPVVGAAFPSCTSIFIRSLDSLPKVVFATSMFDIQEF